MTENYPPEALDRDVKRYLELDDIVQQYLSEMNAIKARLRELGDGQWEAPCGVHVSVTQPNRSFNLTRAVDMLNDEQRTLARADGYDAKKVKQFLPPTLLEACMDPGSGELRVSIK
jgi:hypothetical protein